MVKKRVIISACILGEYCRYDGKTKKFQNVIESFKDYEIIPFCPEAPLFGTPRQKISVVNVDGENKIITEQTKEDVTSLLEKEITTFCKNNPKTDAIVLKSKSPSCGYKTTPILDKNGEVITVGDGIAVAVFKKFYDIEIKNEYL